MKKLDTFWKTNKNWYTRKGCEFKIKDSAPKEAKDSFKRFLEQIKDQKE